MAHEVAGRLRELLKEVLETDGHQVSVADGGQAALDIFRTARREGKPFDPEAPEAFLKEAQAMFDDLGSTTSETKVNEAARTVDVTLIFAGTKNPGGGRRKLGGQP